LSQERTFATGAAEWAKERKGGNKLETDGEKNGREINGRYKLIKIVKYGRLKQRGR
jgi:hypothetical protein